jgi:FixJ family two-component response regulator
LRDVPILIVTSHGHLGPSFLAKGAEDFIQKPFKDEDFFARVEKLLAV